MAWTGTGRTYIFNVDPRDLDLIQTSIKMEKKTGGQYISPSSTKSLGELANIGSSDRLYLVAHGSPGAIDGLTTKQLAQFLYSKGLRSAGKVVMVTCHSATRAFYFSKFQRSCVAKELANDFAKAGIGVGEVVGQRGLTFVDDNGHKSRMEGKVGKLHPFGPKQVNGQWFGIFRKPDDLQKRSFSSPAKYTFSS